MIIVEENLHIKAVAGAVEISIGERVFLSAGNGENRDLM